MVDSSQMIDITAADLTERAGVKTADKDLSRKNIKTGRISAVFKSLNVAAKTKRKLLF